MDNIAKVRSMSLWIFIVPFIAVNACLILITEFHNLFPNKEDVLHNTIPYFDGGASISRTARVFPTYLIFKPAMFFTAYLLIKYWLNNRSIIKSIYGNHKYTKKFVFFGVGSAICLVIHSIFLGVKFDYDLYKLFRRVIMLVFIIFEIVAQAYLVATLYSFREIFSLTDNILQVKKNFAQFVFCENQLSEDKKSYLNEITLFSKLKYSLFWKIIFIYITGH